MDSKGLLLNLSSLRRELQDRKSARSRVDPISERMKRAASPTLLDLHKLRQELASTFISPSPTKRPPVAYSMPANRKELVALYPKRGEGGTRPLPGYKKDAAGLMVESLKRHYNKFFFVWKKHAEELRRAQLRRETIGKSEGAEQKSSKESAGKRKRLSQESGISSRKADYKREDLWSPDPLSFQLYSEAVDDHVAMVSNISHPDIASDLSPESPRKSNTHAASLSSLVQNFKPHMSSRMAALRGDAIRKLVACLVRVMRNRFRGVTFALSFGSSEVLDPVCRLVGAIARGAIRPYWETLRNETVKSMVFQLFTVSILKLSRIFSPTLAYAFLKLRVVRSAPKPRKSGITLKSALQRVLTQRWQAAFTLTKRYADRQQRRIEDYYTSLQRCLLIGDLARIKTLAKFFSRLRARQVPASKPEQNYAKSRVSVGFRVIIQVITSAKNRDLKDFLSILQLYSEEIARAALKKNAASALFSTLRSIRKRAKTEPFSLMHKDFNSAELLRIGKAVMTKLQSKYKDAVRFRLISNFQKWQKNAKKPSAMSNPEAPRFAKIVQGQVLRRMKWSLGLLKALLPERTPMKPLSSEKKAAAMAIGYLLCKVIRGQIWLWGFGLKGTQQQNSGKICNSFNPKAKLISTKVICQWATNHALSAQKSVWTLWKSHLIPARVSNGVAIITHFLQNFLIKRWKSAAFSRRNIERSAEILTRISRKRLERALRKLEPFQTDKSWTELGVVSFPLMQSMKLRVCLQHLRRHQMLVKLSFVKKWGQAVAKSKAGVMKKVGSGVKSLFGLVETVRSRELSVYQLAFQRLAAS